MPVLVLDAAVLRSYRRMAADFRRVFGDRFVSLVAAGPAAAAAFVQQIQPADLDALGPLAETWHQEGVATPLIVTTDEFRRSIDTFPAEYQALLDRHVVIEGTSPLEDIRINPDDLRRACEAQARGHLIHLRQGWVDESAHDHGLAHLIERSAAPLRQVLSNLSRLQGETPTGDAALAVFADKHVGMPESLVAAVLALTDAPHGSRVLVPRLAEYVTASERLWAFIDSWRSR
jgi:hypothetical protein